MCSLVGIFLRPPSERERESHPSAASLSERASIFPIYLALDIDGKGSKGKEIKGSEQRNKGSDGACSHMHGSWTDAGQRASKHGDVLNSVHVTGARAVLLRGVARPPPPPGQSGN